MLLILTCISVYVTYIELFLGYLFFIFCITLTWLLYRFRRWFQQTFTIVGMKCCSTQHCHPWETSSHVLASTASTQSPLRRGRASVLPASLFSVGCVGKFASLLVYYAGYVFIMLVRANHSFIICPQLCPVRCSLHQ